ncbi:hypothetical protein E1295_47600 [Nonomuraea mesophila]|uniref:Uncharacterized protein n=1 Tax=Nonomuraea mesophila TaxID=2530382 RepID=A0A4R5DXK7_9ACTN|nr:hypothetical protein [Nonomuraea mesophila]TDE19708.1 hypothetical protein E1295_47600 [Nonomuraea mesophila]
MPKKIFSIYAVTPGSIWADLYAHGRTVVVEAIDGTHAICTTLTNSHEVQRVIDLPREITRSNPRDMRGTTHRISLDRFRPIHKGFEFVTATGAHLSSQLTTR